MDDRRKVPRKRVLKEGKIVYADGLPKSKLARDPLYVLGDPNGILPEPEPPQLWRQTPVRDPETQRIIFCEWTRLR